MSKLKTIILWVLAVLLMVGFSYYQRMTGPTYPVSGSADFKSGKINYTLPRSHDGDGDALIEFMTMDTTINSNITYRRFKSNDEYKTESFLRLSDRLLFLIPHQPPAGKVEYSISLHSQDGTEKTIADKLRIRFTGHVPSAILIIHILLMFSALCFSTRTALEALFYGKIVLRFAFLTMIILFFGGMVLGPIVQKFAFDAYWTGWPFGEDLTDNKTAIALLMWIIAWWQIKKNPAKSRMWAIIAAIVMLGVFLIPHSMFGSELDYTKLPQK